MGSQKVDEWSFGSAPSTSEANIGGGGSHRHARPRQNQQLRAE
jgi:hypothetical protein